MDTPYALSFCFMKSEEIGINLKGAIGSWQNCGNLNLTPQHGSGCPLRLGSHSEDCLCSPNLSFKFCGAHACNSSSNLVKATIIYSGFKRLNLCEPSRSTWAIGFVD